MAKPHSPTEPRSIHASDNPASVANLCSNSLAARLGPSLAQLHPDFAARMEKFAQLLAIWGARLNLTARPRDGAETAFHIHDSLAPFLAAGSDSPLARIRLPGASLLDIGSGAGFPGLILACAFGTHTTLMEPRRRRASFLHVAAGELSLTNVRVEAVRVSSLKVSAERFDLVTVRAVGDSAALLDAASAALREGGLLVMYTTPGKSGVDATGMATAGARMTPLGEVAYELEHVHRRIRRAVALWRCDKVL